MHLYFFLYSIIPSNCAGACAMCSRKNSKLPKGPTRRWVRVDLRQSPRTLSGRVRSGLVRSGPVWNLAVNKRVASVRCSGIPRIMKYSDKREYNGNRAQ